MEILGIGILEARGAIARFLQIFRLCLRHGWFGNWPNVRPRLVAGAPPKATSGFEPLYEALQASA